MTVRFYSSTAPEVTLTGGISNVDTIIVVSSTTGFPISIPYTLAIDYGAAIEELVEVTNAAGTSLTVTRAIDGTSAASHGAGAKIRHVSSARDFKDSRDHENSNIQHGATGAVVGTTNTQTLTNKTLRAANTTTPSVIIEAVPSQTVDIVKIKNLLGDEVINVSFGGIFTSNLQNILENVTVNAPGAGFVALNVQDPVDGTLMTVSSTETFVRNLRVDGVGGYKNAIKTVDTTRTTTTQSLDPHLQISLTSGATYIIEALIVVKGSDTSDINVGWSGVTASLGNWTPAAYNQGVIGNSGEVELVTSDWTTSRAFGISSTPTTRYGYKVHGFLTASSSGSFGLNWACFNSTAGAVVCAGSYITARRIS